MHIVGKHRHFTDKKKSHNGGTHIIRRFDLRPYQYHSNRIRLMS